MDGMYYGYAVLAIRKTCDISNNKSGTNNSISNTVSKSILVTKL